MKTAAAILAALLSLPTFAGEATGHFQVGITILPPEPSGLVSFQGGVPTRSSTRALHPECTLADDQLVVRGVVYDLTTNRPAPGARVVVRNGPRYLAGATDRQGRYTIYAQKTDAMSVTVVQASRIGKDGLRIINVPMGRAACRGPA